MHLILIALKWRGTASSSHVVSGKRSSGRSVKFLFTREAIAAYFCARDKATPVYVKASIFAALAYFIVPVDLIPDVIIGLGYTDDITVFWAAWQAIKGHITAEHRKKAVAALEQLPV